MMAQGNFEIDMLFLNSLAWLEKMRPERQYLARRTMGALAMRCRLNFDLIHGLAVRPLACCAA